MLVFLLILVAGLLVVAELITNTIVFAYVAVGVCVLCLAAVGLAVYRDRRARKPQETDATEAAHAAEQEEAEEEEDAVASADQTEAAEESPAEPEPVPAVDGANDSMVCVIPGRMRYHRPGCSSLDGREYERVTLDEAREEGFSQCTSCAEAVPAASGSHRERLR